MRRLLGIILAFAIVLPASPAAAKVFKNCAELRSQFKYGVALSSSAAKAQAAAFYLPKVSKALFQQNKRLDTDKDGVVCEVSRPVKTPATVESESATPIPGALCPPGTPATTLFDRSYACLIQGTRSRWSSGTLDRSFVYSTDSGFSHSASDYCRVDNDAGPEWEKFQQYMISIRRGCIGPLRIPKYVLGSAVPATSLSSSESPVEACKAESNSRMWLKGFPADRQRLQWNSLGRNAVIQIIPIFAPDTAAPSNSPKVDYAHYFDFVEKYVRSISDLPVSFQIRVPDQYFEFDQPLKPYGVSHKLEGPHPTVLGDIMAQVGSQIDFRGATTALVLVPFGTRQDVWQQGPLGFYRAGSTALFGVSSQYPANNELLSPVPEFLNLSTPAWWVHELYHTGIGLDDHYGNSQMVPTPVSGMGFWGLMSPSITDLLGWEKWFLDHIGDSQVDCLNPQLGASTVWLRPSAVSTTQSKLAVVRTSPSTVLVMESIRAAGMNLSLAPAEQGLLVYTVDVKNDLHGFGFDLKYPTSRAGNLNGSFSGSRAPLKRGEFVLVDGVRIEVVESGSFGDVVRVTQN
jgi:Excalibur calcium-binding domain